MVNLRQLQPNEKSYFLITYHPSIIVQWLGMGGQNEQTPAASKPSTGCPL
jgi:hypothetical protein